MSTQMLGLLPLTVSHPYTSHDFLSFVLSMR